MNNNQMNFDPITGQPINQNTNNIDNNVVHNTLEQNNINNVQQVPITETTQTIQNTQSVANITTQEVSTDLVNNNVLPQQQMQNIPTVDQDKQEFCLWIWNRSLLGRYGSGEQVHDYLSVICREFQDLVATNLGDASVRGMDDVGGFGLRSFPPALQSVDR